MLINCTVAGEQCRMDTADLQDCSSRYENDNEIGEITEYRLDGVVVHRSADIRLKRSLSSMIEAAVFS